MQLHVGDKNTGANEYDFKNALDILHLAVQVIYLNTLFSTLIQTIVSQLALELSEVNELWIILYPQLDKTFEKC